MRELSLIFVLCLVCTLPALAQQVVPTPPGPVTLIPHNNVMNVLCSRVDANFNGVQDNGDSPASWIQVDIPTLQSLRTYTFPWAQVNAARVGVARGTGLIYFGVDNTVESFSLTNQTSNGTVYRGSVSAVSSTLQGTAIYISQRPNFTDPGSVIQYTLESSDSIVYPAGVNPQQTGRFITSTNVQGLYVLNEGLFGQQSGSLDIWKPTQFGPSKTTVEVGDTPNHVWVQGDSAYVTVNGSHWIVVVNLASAIAVDTILVGTTGFDGPRESCISNGKLFVSTFSGDVRVFDVATGVKTGSITLDAKPEGIAVVGGNIWVTRAFLLGGYSVERNVAVYNIDQSVSVSATHPTPSVPTAVIATSGRVRLPFKWTSDLSMYDSNGRRTHLQTVDSESGILDVSSLSPGVYVVSNGTTAITILK